MSIASGHALSLRQAMKKKEAHEAIARLTRTVVAVSALLFLTIGMVVYLQFKPAPAKEKTFFCGTIGPDDNFDDRKLYRSVANALNHDFDPERGQDLFNGNCRACHRLSAQVSIGPGMEDLFKRIPNAEWLVGFMNANDSILNNYPDYNQTLQIYQRENGRRYHGQKQLSSQKLLDILGFLGMM